MSKFVNVLCLFWVCGLIGCGAVKLAEDSTQRMKYDAGSGRFFTTDETPTPTTRTLLAPASPPSVPADIYDFLRELRAEADMWRSKYFDLRLQFFEE